MKRNDFIPIAFPAFVVNINSACIHTVPVVVTTATSIRAPRPHGCSAFATFLELNENLQTTIYGTASFSEINKFSLTNK